MNKTLTTAVCTAWLAVFGLMNAPGLAGNADAGIVLGPALSFPSSTGISVWWNTDDEGTCRHDVEYGKTGTLGQVAAFEGRTTTPFVTLEGLSPDSIYYYRVRTCGSVSPVQSFKTLKDAAEMRSVRLGVWGDNQRGTDVFSRNTIPALLSYSPDFLVGLGDFVQDPDSYHDWKKQFYKPAARLLGSIALFPARGNHDGEGRLALNMLPYRGGGSWYSAVIGPLYLVVLDTNLDLAQGSSQYDWFIAQTRSSAWKTASFRAVVHHRPAYTNLWSGKGYDGDAALRLHLAPAMEEAGVDVVINGHSHGYQHGVSNSAYGRTHYFVMGGGGVTLDRDVTNRWPNLTTVKSRYHIGIIDITASRMTVQVIDTIDQTVLDTVVIDPR